MVTFTQVNCGPSNKDIAYTFHFVNNSTKGTMMYYNLGATLAAQPVQYLGGASPFAVQVVSGNMSQWVGPGQTAACNFNAPGLLQSGQPPLVAFQPNQSVAPLTLCCRFWSGGGSVGTLIGVVGDAIQAGISLVETGVDVASAVDGDPVGAFSAVIDAMNTVQNMAQMGATAESNEDQYLNIIVNPQSGSFNWTIQTDSPTMCSATNPAWSGYNPLVIIDGGGNSCTTQNIYIQYSD